MLKIEKDKEKAEKIAKDKAEIMQKRAVIRRRADDEKQEMMQKVQQMKKQGDFDKTELAALGIHVKSDNDESAVDLTRDVGNFENTLNQDSMTQESKTRSQLSFQQRSKSHMTDSERREIMESLQDRQKREMNHLVKKQKVQKQQRDKTISNEKQNQAKQKLEKRNDMEDKIAKKQQDLLAKDHIDEIEEYTRDNDIEEGTQYASPEKATREAKALVYPLDVNSSQSKNGDDRYSRNIELENTTDDTVFL
jgi:hypothetical protein